MKQFYLTVLSLSMVFLCQAQFTIDMGYGLSLPAGNMKNKLSPIHLFRLGSAYILPGKLNRFSTGFELGLGNYSSFSREVELSLPGAQGTLTNIRYHGNSFLANATLQADLLKNKRVIPYLGLKGGVHKLYSTIIVDDPHDEDECEPLERRNIIRDNSLNWSYGGGLRVKLGSRHQYGTGAKHFLNLQVMATRGEMIDYINTKKLKDLDNNATIPPPGPDGKPVEMRFINIRSNTTHNHMVAEQYTTPLRLLDIRITYQAQF